MIEDVVGVRKVVVKGIYRDFCPWVCVCEWIGWLEVGLNINGTLNACVCNRSIYLATT